LYTFIHEEKKKLPVLDHSVITMCPPLSIGTSSPVFMELYINAIPLEANTTLFF